MTLATWAETAEARILINLFTDHTSEEMKTAEGQRLIADAFQFPVAEYSDRVQHTALRDPFVKLSEIRKRVDQIADELPDDPQAQCRKAAQLLKKYRRQNSMPEMAIANTFVKSALAPRWDARLKVRLSSILRFFENTDYFLSYTNKQADQTNSDFKKTFYPKTKALCRTCNDANLLARQIMEHLSGIGLLGYYDKEQIELGDKVRPEILRGAGSALVFLQVVSAVMLTDDEGENWCFHEYVAYKNQDFSAYNLALEDARLFIFLIAERPVQQGRPADAVRPPSDIREAYKHWHNDMLRLATTHLERSSCEKLREQIRTVARQIGKFRNSVLETIEPGEFYFSRA